MLKNTIEFRRLKAGAGKSLAAIARELDLHPQTVANWHAGTASIPPGRMAQLTRILKEARRNG
jgi:transcriptional regulator with XRE-family HTH domain